MSYRLFFAVLSTVVFASVATPRPSFAQIESYQVETHASGEIPITPFDTSRGTLHRVVLDVVLRPGRTSDFGVHWHQVGSAFASGETTPGGGHAHLVEVPRYFSNGLTLPGLSFVTSPVSSHVHDVPFSTGSRPTSTAGPHSHSIPQVVRQVIFVGESLVPFHGPAFSLRTPILSVLPAGAHNHGFHGRATSTGGAHQHRFLPSWTVLTTFEYEPAPRDAAIEFLRGEVNQDGRTDVTDGIAIFSYLFLGDDAPRCFDSADVNDDGDVNLSDGIFLLESLFLGAEAPVAPGEGRCEPDTTEDSLPDCEFGDESCA